LGEAAALGSAFFWAISALLVKSVSGRLSTFYIMAVRAAFAALIALAIFAAAGPDLSGLDFHVTVLLLASAAMAMLGDTAFVRALAVEDVSRLFTVSTSLYILMSVAGSVAFAGGPFSALLVLAGLAVLVGSRLVLHRQNPESETAPARQQSQRNPGFALWLGIVAALLWSVSLLVISEAMESVDALSAAAIRLPFMAVTLGAIATMRGEYRQGVRAEDLKILLASGALVVGAMTLFLLSAKLSTAGTVAVLTSTSPIFVAPLAHFFLDERLTLRIGAGTLICMAGIWLATT
jgi:drug/metabolite transporter (DMT)-like permease